MSNFPDFLKTKDVEDAEGIGLSEMEQLATLIRAYDEYAAHVAEIEEQLNIAKKTFNRISMEEIPNFLLSHGVTEMKLTDGRKVTVKEDISATVTDDKAFKTFLLERNETDIIKVNCAFAKMEAEQMTKLMDFLMDNDYDFDAKEDIHHQTKKAYFKALIKQLGRDNLPEFVNIFDLRTTKIK